MLGKAELQGLGGSGSGLWQGSTGYKAQLSLFCPVRKRRSSLLARNWLRNTLGDPGDQEAYQKFLKSWDIRNNKHTWIGLSDQHNEGSCQLVDKSPLQLWFWKEGEPNNLRDKDRVQLPGDGWNDTECSVEDLWICKKPFARCPGL
ncbi:hypothetical protein mRhiFer1_002431 [Rhinolophus ferrumequinum]|uniref:C-type lectin domain-containing protein n=1 Tax=Rhinolophus ferrumequinum TaxID=59479 RepID=A0A7J7TZA0_RHIFE|nr:hypothetical protein mRhiFer1_002431 [Rhinolophus ferrumequinum]